MIRVFDFLCTKCGETQEEFIQDDVKTLPCRACGGASKRQLAAPRIDWLRSGVDPDFPSAADKWAKAHSHIAKKDKGGSEKGQNLKMY